MCIPLFCQTTDLTEVGIKKMCDKRNNENFADLDIKSLIENTDIGFLEDGDIAIEEEEVVIPQSCVNCLYFDGNDEFPCCLCQEAPLGHALEMIDWMDTCKYWKEDTEK